MLARGLADSGRQVHVLERRPHVGGNLHDRVHSSGIRLNDYGPHYFRTSSRRIWDYVHRFSQWYPYEAVVQSFVEGRFESWPISQSYLQRRFPEWRPAFRGNPGNFEEACLAQMPEEAYRLFVHGYTEKQWGVPARSLPAELAARFRSSQDDDPRLKSATYQGLPVDGYTHFIERMLAGIPVSVDHEFQHGRIRVHRLLVYTGPIDQFFGFELGRLAYRGQRRELEYRPDVPRFQPAVQVNYPDPAAGPHIRVIEWKHMMREDKPGTVLTTETPWTPDDPDGYEYPFPDQANQALYRRYREKADGVPKLLVCGRLGEYRYYDMDQAIARALKLLETLVA